MNPLILAPVLDIFKTLAERWFPDPEKKAQAEYAMLSMLQEKEFQVALKQLEVNAAEASNPSLFVSGWRPFVGWLCGFGLLYSTFGISVISWISGMNGYPSPPKVDTTEMLVILAGMLGIGGLRTIEKKAGVAQ